MNFLEKNLETILIETPNELLRNRGLKIYGKKRNQVRLGNYGIADLITLKKAEYSNFGDKMKDPAFLFYSKDFYEGTRMMLPNERACYIDLIIYQHQNGLIPLDLDRVLMYCSGCDKATLIATLKAKFKQTDKGYYNEKLNSIISERKEFTEKQSVNGMIGQFWKKSKAILTGKNYLKLKELLVNKTNTEILELIKDKEINKTTLEAMLEAMLKHLADANVDVIEDVIEYKKEIPTFEEFKNFAIEKKPTVCINSLQLKYQAWIENGWKDGKDKKIVNWKSKLLNTLPYINETNQRNNTGIKKFNDVPTGEISTTWE